VNVTQQDQILFATLFTYDAARRATWYVLSNGSRQANGSYLGALHQVRGPPFNAVPFTPITGANLTEVGTMRLSFSDGERGSLDYSINGTRVVKSIVRQVFSSPVPACN
jgi:hypothetical protein